MASTLIGQRAIVIGAGIAGLSAARALSDYFEQVVVLERDALPDGPVHRPGTPQARHAHGLLVGGQRALSELFPGFERDLVEAGAVTVRTNIDIRVERPGSAQMIWGIEWKSLSAACLPSLRANPTPAKRSAHRELERI